MSENPSNWLLVEHSHVHDVELVAMQVDWMCNLVVDIHEHQFHICVQIDFDDMQAPASSKKLVVEAVLADGAVFVAELRLVDVLRLSQQGEVRELHADVVECSDAVEVRSGCFN